MTVQYFQLIGQPQRNRFVAFSDAYHGDTLGAASLGGVKVFHERFAAHFFLGGALVLSGVLLAQMV